MLPASSADLGRRDFLGLLGTLLGSSGGRVARAGDGEEGLPPVRAITRGPKHHWFGYYDKREFDPMGRFVLGTVGAW